MSDGIVSWVKDCIPNRDEMECRTWGIGRLRREEVTTTTTTIVRLLDVGGWNRLSYGVWVMGTSGSSILQRGKVIGMFTGKF